MISHPLEIDYWNSSARIVGIDEAGRGPIAGPLVVAGVVFDKGYRNEEIDDSKKLSEKKRERLFEQIIEDAKAYEILVVCEQTIDALNIYRATQVAMEQIAKDLKGDLVLTDAMPLRNYDGSFVAVVKGDQKSLSIAAASILAKVTRDHWMFKLDAMHEEYGFKNHKGYPTKQHIENLSRYGVLDIHRKSYGPVKKQLEIKLF
ncbi:ribonuclease HII [uncultured Dubosiella sp.]|uniref:ribonuclease HII n=1 Tax=uncultured Dubosiella sp. TaxID=1937011 RepID=UPI00262F4AE8|nr:ribonuclease HII [uncultured Dubosiella sp.]